MGPLKLAPASSFEVLSFKVLIITKLKITNTEIRYLSPISSTLSAMKHTKRRGQVKFDGKSPTSRWLSHLLAPTRIPRQSGWLGHHSREGPGPGQRK